MRVAGSILRTRELFVRQYGNEAFAAFVAGLSADTRQVLQRGFLETHWYPYDLFCEVMDVADQVLGAGDHQLCYEMGRFGADHNLTTLYRIFFKLGSVNFIISRAAKAWRAQYDTGKMNVVRQTRTGVTLQLEGFPRCHRGHCLAIMGWMARAGEISGAELESIDELCRALGDPVCQWTFTWS